MTRSVIAMAMLVILPSGCTGVSSPPDPTPTSPAGRVVRVVDGDTVDVETPTGRQRIRVLGVDAPEMAHDGRPAQCGAQEARQGLARLVEGRTISWEPDPKADATDRYGRQLAYLHTDKTPDVGLALIQAGHVAAWKPKSAPAPSRYPHYQAATKTAQSSRVGSWATCPHIGR